MTRRKFAKLCLHPLHNKGAYSHLGYNFISQCCDYEADISPDTPAIALSDPSITLDDFLYDYQEVDKFRVDWTIYAYPIDQQGAILPVTIGELSAISHIYSDGSTVLTNVFASSLQEIASGMSYLQNPYFDPCEETNEEE